MECLLSLGAESFVFQSGIQKYKNYDIQNYIFSLVLCGCQTWSLTLREERRLRVRTALFWVITQRVEL